MNTGEGNQRKRRTGTPMGIWCKLLVAMAGMFMILPLFVLRAEAGYVFDSEDCRNFSYYASDGSTVKMSDFTEDAVVLIFGRETCFNCKSTTNIAASAVASGTNVKVVFLKVDDSYPSEEYTWEDHVAAYGKYISLTRWSMTQNNRAYWSIQNVREVTGNSLPLVVILDKNRRLSDCYKGLDTDRLLEGIGKITTNKFVKPDYTYIASPYTYGITVETGKSIQLTPAFNPSNSFALGEWEVGDSSIAKVNSDGVLTGLKEGKTSVFYYASTSYMPATITVVKGVKQPDGIKLNETSKVAAKGNTISLKATVTPADADDKTVKWSSSNPSVATVDANGKVSCKGVGKTIITATTVNNLKATCEFFVLAENNPENPFADVASGGWEYNAARYVYDNGFMNGQGELVPGKVIFSPHTAINRSQFVRTLYNVEGSPQTTYIQKFSDVEPGKWYSKPITWAEQAGIVAGYTNGTFGINDTATREQLAMMFYKYAKYKGYSTKVIDGKGKRVSDFPDANLVSSWAVEPLNWALSQGIMSGKGSGKLDPRGNATRVECAVMLRNFKNAFAFSAMGLYDADFVFPEEPEGIQEEDVVIEEADADVDIQEPEIVEPEGPEVVEPEEPEIKEPDPATEEPEKTEPEKPEPEVKEPEEPKTETEITETEVN